MKKCSVFVLDDAEAITMLTRSALTMYNFEVTECNDPLAALEIVKSRTFDVIMVDIMMPEMDGITFLKTIKEFPIDPHTRFVVLSSKKLTPGEEKEIFSLGAVLLSKPFIPRVLVEKITELLQ
ncbi:MAG: response regulator [Spirochaetales bacterium]|nr:response regulator [Spirochaetales bacterium]